MEERNEWIHVCDRCMCIFLMPDGSFSIVGDGLSMGRTCCGVFRCPKPLQNNRHRFCAEHSRLHDVCAIVGCENPVIQVTVNDPKGGPAKIVNKKTCPFLYKEQLQHAQISQPVDSFSQSCCVPEQDIQEDFESYTVHPSNSSPGVVVSIQKNPGSVGVLDQDSELASIPPIPCPSKSLAGNQPTLKAQFGWCRTHNEQTLVWPCGVIFARATMFGAEAVSNFLVMVKNTFSVPGAQKPEHIFYDTNCLARQQAEKDPWFKGIGIMTNAWLGEMLPAKYDFFLDKMIHLQNIEGHHPSIL
ncbi:hypothetical protein BYT27DRAFT_7224636 [Phlegmacium glaucopus]|nr:hypothetical protein BYT27DRAFT_7224636 [Phlegmacium glaucopus]